MQRKTRRMIIAVAVIALLAAGGAAFTAAIAGIDGQTVTAGFGSETVHGATATQVQYHLSADGQYVDQVSVVLTGHDYTSGYTIKAGFNDNTSTYVACTPTLDADNTDTDVSCDFTGGAGPTHGVAVDNAASFDMSVTDATTGNFDGH
jgi:hypothetical protein